ncbi:probable leucine-rich repeat receptor-like protein kinase At5g49770 [Neltuma alba]|uniref:probable leucine-rich repeat receptor-like protein kinase At5g49770 n=1 Tax=Neltuma alba TaxID=207710 RepID=UPI0010A38C05|nr:probable leucine-rich repeat receptor-like protein kinase At5g49770 [Prosopis alba]
MEQVFKVFLLLLLCQSLLVSAQSSYEDFVSLQSLTESWQNKPPSWVGSDPCGSGWEGIRCTNLRVTSIILASMNLVGKLSSDIQLLSELDTLDLSYNKGLTGTIPKEIGNLRKLKTLILVGCSFFGSIPDSIGSLQQLNFLALNSNQFNGNIPPTIGNLSNINWLDLSDNHLEGAIPISGQGVLGLEKLLKAKHFHMGNNRLSGGIPAQLFHSDMSLVHVLFDSNQLSGGMPSTIGVVNSLEAVRFDRNQLSGSVPSNISNLRNLSDLLARNRICLEAEASTERYCQESQSNSIYSTLPNNCSPPPCSSGQISRNESKKSSHIGIIVGVVVAVVVFLAVALLAGIYVVRQKKRAKGSAELNPFANWKLNKNNGMAPQLKGARWFSLEELKKYTNNFSEDNTVGSGGYGKVYRAVLPTGELVAIKRAAEESMQGAVEFKTEIELLSRVHHKNLVGLAGFCFENGEQMLVYEYIPNGTLMDSLSGKSGIRMDWMRRLKVALGAARGLAYLHELANPPIIHRDIKSSNILLDEHLNAKVADFGLSKLLVDSERGHITTQVKGTMGYLDPEYYMTQQLTEKSDVYSFGVLMLELVTARRPIEKGKYIVREVQNVMDTTKELFNLHSIIDPFINKVTPRGLDKFVELAMRCVKEYAAERPSMAEVVKEIENIMELAGLNPASESDPTTEEIDMDANGGKLRRPYAHDEGFSYSGAFPSTKVEPQ